jgi:hypothetical protein
MRQEEHGTGSEHVFLRGRLGSLASADAEGFACNILDRYGALARADKFSRPESGARRWFLMPLLTPALAGFLSP